MARPEETGLKYFPFNVDFFNDEKIEAISGEFGIKGEIVAVKLLCAIYRNGYFIEWTDLYKMKLLRNLPSISSDLLDAIIKRLVKWGFFDKTLFDSEKILTSAGIQRRYFDAVRRRKLSGSFPYVIDSPSIIPPSSSDPANCAPAPGSVPASEAAGLAPVPDASASVPGSVPVTAASGPPALVSVIDPSLNEGEYFSDLSHPSSLRDTICMRFHLNETQLIEKLNTFLLDCKCRDTTHDNRRDALNHFNDWLRIVTEAEKQKNHDNNEKETAKRQRRGVKAVTSQSKDYEATF